MADAIGVRSTRTNGGPSSRSIKVGGDLRSPLILLEKENVSVDTESRQHTRMR